MNFKLSAVAAAIIALALPCLAQYGPGPGADTNIDLSKLPPASTKTGVTFATDIKPIFDANCVGCHGANRPSGGLRLDNLEGIMSGMRGRGGGPNIQVLTPGDSAHSTIVVAVARLNPRSAMPRPPRRQFGGPGGPGAGGPSTNAAATPPAPAAPAPKNLTPEEVGLVRAWIDQGAK
jgi:mono/diheme cytochrome c family protein